MQTYRITHTNNKNKEDKMKTRFLFALLISFALLSAGSAFAATQTGTGPGDMVIGASGNPVATVPISKNVTLSYTGNQTPATYAAFTSHANGTKTFGTTNATTVLYYKVETPGTSVVESTAIDFSSWTAQ